MFNRSGRRFTDKYRKDASMFGGDEYAAKWLTRICDPEQLPYTGRLLDTPIIRPKLSMISWSKQNAGKNAEEIF